MAEFLKKLNFGFLHSFSQNGGFVALDIGSSSVKLVETAVEKSGYRVLNLGVAPLPPKAIQNNMVADSSLVADAIRKLIQENKVSATQVISAVPGRAVIMKKVQLPRQEDDELEANVEFEANNVIPENLQNINLDYQVLNYVAAGDKMEVLLVAVKKEIVNSYADVIVEAGLKPAIMDVDYFAMENMYEANYTAESAGMVGLIHIGARYTSITLLQNGLSTFTGDLPIGGEEFTQLLKKELNISDESAENLKLTGALGGKKTTDVKLMLQPMIEELTGEIRRTVTLYGSVGSEDGEGLKTIYLSGGSAKLPGLESMLQEKMGVPAILAEPFRGFTINRKIDRSHLVETAPLFAVAAGLSIRRPGDK
ncbi:MAG TPA: type IV pilus assembly protein PilM [Candidatus Binatia bacterium]|nr:type IV pilus assembly protein PilM [Candidatus Binatia bacterium]